jgi:hypothetical protein
MAISIIGTCNSCLSLSLRHGGERKDKRNEHKRSLENKKRETQKNN